MISSSTDTQRCIAATQIFYLTEALPPKKGGVGLQVFPSDLKYNSKGLIVTLLLCFLSLCVCVTYPLWS